MATVGNGVITMADYAKRLGADNKIARIINILLRSNPILDDMLTIECNNGTSHLTTIEAGLPNVIWRQMYQGIPNDKGTVVQIEDSCGELAGLSKVETGILEMAEDKAALLLQESQMFFEQMKLQMAQTLFYGNSATDPEQFMGLHPRYSSLSAHNGSNIVNAAGTGAACTSMWLMIWGENTVHCIYPKNSQAGLQHQEIGEEPAVDAAGNEYRVYKSQFKWKNGLCLRNWKSVGRIANINTTLLATAGTAAYTGPNIQLLMIEIYNKMKRFFGLGRPVFYCNATLMTAIDKLASTAGNTMFTVSNGIDGMPVTSFRGVPIHQCDAILDTESAIS